VARARDGRGPPTLLTSTLLEKAGLSDPPALIPWAAAASKGEVAALAPLVLAAAEQGDPPARVIFHRALEEIRRHLEVVRRGWEPWGPPIPIAMAGGMVEGGGSLKERVTGLILEMGGRIPPDPVLPVRGAAKKALAIACQNGR
jgi:N-acetylglucosamine kinase-like BadF-type ATPase